MATPKVCGNCYLCGAELGKTAMKNHILKVHRGKDDDQKCYLLKIEGLYNKNYWLFIDVPIDKTLATVDAFLRRIWLECCGHLSEFTDSAHNEIGSARKVGSFSVGDTLCHEYDFGSTTETVVTFVGETTRKKQKEPIRLLARNKPPVFICDVCGKPADYICTECVYDSDNPFYCEACSVVHEHEEMFLPVTNSPRMGECGYEGELDVYEFDLGNLPERV